jgi:putative serine protease PepD
LLGVGVVLVGGGGTAVADPDDVAAAVQDRRPGESVSLEIKRGGSTQTLQAKLAERPANATP